MSQKSKGHLQGQRGPQSKKRGSCLRTGAQGTQAVHTDSGPRQGLEGLRTLGPASKLARGYSIVAPSAWLKIQGRKCPEAEAGVTGHKLCRPPDTL